MSGAIDTRTGRPISRDAQRWYDIVAYSYVREFANQSRENRIQVERWLGRGVAVLIRCAACVRAGVDAEARVDTQAVGFLKALHVPDGPAPDSTDRLAVYSVCDHHLRPPWDQEIVPSVVWWATRDGDGRPGRIVVVYDEAVLAGFGT